MKSENARQREQQQATDRANLAEGLAYVNSLIEASEERERAQAEADAELRRYFAPYRPDETDDQWAKEWEDDFAQSEREYEQLGGYR